MVTGLGMMEFIARGEEEPADFTDSIYIQESSAFYVFKKKPNTEGGKVVVFFRERIQRGHGERLEALTGTSLK